MWYDDIKEVFVSFYTVKLTVLEEDLENQRSGMTISRVRLKTQFIELSLIVPCFSAMSTFLFQDLK